MTSYKGFIVMYKMILESDFKSRAILTLLTTWEKFLPQSRP